MRKLSLVALLLVGCDAEHQDELFELDLVDEEVVDDLADPEPGDLPFDHLPPPPTLSMTGTCPGPVTFNVTSATPSANVRFFWAQVPGQSNIPNGVCAGTLIRLVPPISVSAPFTANGAGNVTASTTLNAGICGWFLHVLDMTTCTFSPAIIL